MSGPSSHRWVRLQPTPPNPPPNLTMRGHTNVAVDTAFSPDGKFVDSGSCSV
ncbi:hypothetical protein PILCRDRAFT_825683 [Piloderma croceum F 1598]|uniref:Uncharacterized protein n=1 Tax=Piloderma croceum (strain F 1598) TaxID=765440 RepID=A0A0C3EX99_PILCF|nr:hypothetical protein PILCRDRAFT_825683 [Piloderma croceum F 1598]